MYDQKSESKVYRPALKRQGKGLKGAGREGKRVPGLLDPLKPDKGRAS